MASLVREAGTSTSSWRALAGVADAREHVRDGIGDVHGATSSTWSRPAARPAGRAPGSRCGTVRSGACSRAADRRRSSGGSSRTGNRCLRCGLGDEGLLGHRSAPSPSAGERHAEERQQTLGLLVVGRRRDDAHLEPAQAVDLVVVDLRERELLAQAQGVVATAVERACRARPGSRGCAAARRGSAAPGSPTCARRGASP